MISESNASAGRAILWGGLLCGILDIAYAFLFFGAVSGVRPERLLQGIAFGVLGRSTYAGGLKTASLGLFLHFVIAYGAATVYYLASRRLHFMIRQAVIAGMLYGVAIHLFMQFVVIPLSVIGPRPLNLGVFVINAFEHMFLVGLPISLAVRRFSGAAPREESGHALRQPA
jgi:uncharacterized membrane protein YagU involved in acid resistance